MLQNIFIRRNTEVVICILLVLLKIVSTIIYILDSIQGHGNKT